MTRTMLAVALLLGTVLAGCASSPPATDTTCDDASRQNLNLQLETNTVVAMGTSAGCVLIELFDTQAPTTVQNFAQYVQDGFYTNTFFHRIIPDFVVQGGGFDESQYGRSNPQQKQTRAPIPLENENGLRNVERTLAMARTPDPNSATSQFYFNTGNNSPALDRGGPNHPGYAVFGRVVAGWSAVETIEMAGTRSGTPTEKHTITSARILPAA
jgi:peptidyl-prolyl cis-trans isomerase A (cyclophilin A)